MQETKMFDKNGEPARSLETTTQPVPDCSFEMQPPGSDSGPAEHSCKRPRAKALPRSSSCRNSQACSETGCAPGIATARPRNESPVSHCLVPEKPWATPESAIRPRSPDQSRRGPALAATVDRSILAPDLCCWGTRLLPGWLTLRRVSRRRTFELFPGRLILHTDSVQPGELGVRR